MIAQIIDRYSEKAPAALMFRGLFARLFARLFADDVLDKIFAEHREKQVESPVLLSYLVGLLVPVISGGRASVNAAYQASPCDVSLQAVYGKLRGVETQVSSALVRSTVKELIRIQDKLKLQKKDVIPGYHTYVIDGKTYNATEPSIVPSHNLRAYPKRCLTLSGEVVKNGDFVLASKGSDTRQTPFRTGSNEDRAIVEG